MRPRALEKFKPIKLRLDEVPDGDLHTLSVILQLFVDVINSKTKNSDKNYYQTRLLNFTWKIIYLMMIRLQTLIGAFQHLWIFFKYGNRQVDLPTSESEDENEQETSTANEIQISPTETMAKKDRIWALQHLWRFFKYGNRQVDLPISESEDENEQETSTANEIQISPTETMTKKDTQILAASICE